jgi:hypothetical protein
MYPDRGDVGPYRDIALGSYASRLRHRVREWPLNATTSGFRPALAKDCKNTTLARIRQPLRTFLGDSQQFLAFLQNNEPDYSSDILKLVQAERFLGVTCLIRSW